jgi:hypothetical protein
VTGDEVRGVWFLGARGPGNYNKADVNDLLARVAAELDSGRPAGPLIANATFRAPSTFVSKIGCLTGAVDWFLEQLRLQEESSEMARMNTDPWRDLATEPYCVYREPGELAGLVAAPPQQEYADAWRNFGCQPGTGLSWVQAGAHRYELRTAGQQTLAASKGRRSATLSTDGRTFTWRPGSPGLAETIGRDRPGAPAHLLKGRTDIKDTDLRMLIDQHGIPVLYTGGRHLSYHAGAYIKFPGHRWLRFPVRGTGISDAIMTAVDQANETSDSAAGSRMPAASWLAMAGPALATVRVQVPVPPTVMLAGQDNTAEMSALEEALATVALNGPAVTVPATLAAVTV